MRLLWLSPTRVEPAEAFAALANRRPAPEPIPFAESSPDLIGRRLADMILVDARESPGDASALIRKLRSETEAPFIAVVSQSSIDAFDFDCGIADFVVEDCTDKELDARLERIARPSMPDPGETLRRGEITINRERFEVKVSGEVLDLTFKEFELIAYLAQRPGKVCSRNSLLSEVWGYDFFGGTRTVDVHVRRLRAKLGSQANIIETVRNVGYRFAG
ncbi:MAG: winged helix-turn-helix domain-containing protein [Actinomycetota bacterium]